MDTPLTLTEIYFSVKKEEDLSLKKISDDSSNERFFMQTFWGANERIALYEWFINHDLKKIKQHFYKCGRMLEFETKKYNAQILSYGMSHISYLLLSDNFDLIRRFADFTYESTPSQRSHLQGIEKGYGNSLVYLLQCIIKDDWSEFERIMPIVETSFLKRHKTMVSDLTFVKSLANGDKSKIENILTELVQIKTHKKRNTMPLINEFISHPAIGYAKLAWYKGIEVDINSPLMPKEWLPIQPLKDEEYVDYDFVKAYLG